MEQFEQKPVPADIQSQIGTVPSGKNLQGEIGALSSLNTTEKGSLVGAVNELNSKITKYTNMQVTTNANGLFYPSVPTGAIILNVINLSSSTYAIVQFNDASFIAFDASVGGWSRASEKTFNIRVIYYIT